MGMRGCVWVGEIFSSHDKWQIKKNATTKYGSRNVMGVELHHTNDIMWHHVTSSVWWGGGVCHTGGSVMESYQFEILDQYFSVIVTIPHISIESQSLCIPTYFSVYLKPREVIIMHKIHKYLKTFLLADDSIRHHDVTWSWPVLSLIFEFDIWGWRDGTRHLSSAQPHDSPLSAWPPITAPQPHSLHLT